MDSGLDFGGTIIQNWTLGGHKCLSLVKSFLALLFAIGNIAVRGSMTPPAPWTRPWVCNNKKNLHALTEAINLERKESFAILMTKSFFKRNTYLFAASQYSEIFLILSLE